LDEEIYFSNLLYAILLYIYLETGIANNWTPEAHRAAEQAILGYIYAFGALLLIDVFKLLARLFGGKSHNDIPSQENKNPEEIKPSPTGKYGKEYILVSDHEKWRFEKKVSEYLDKGYKCEGSVSKMEVELVMSYCQSMVTDVWKPIEPEKSSLTQEEKEEGLKRLDEVLPPNKNRDVGAKVIIGLLVAVVIINIIFY